MGILKRFKRTKVKENKALPSLREDADKEFVDAQILVARARTYAMVYGARKYGKN